MHIPSEQKVDRRIGQTVEESNCVFGELARRVKRKCGTYLFLIRFIVIV